MPIKFENNFYRGEFGNKYDCLLICIIDFFYLLTDSDVILMRPCVQSYRMDSQLKTINLQLTKEILYSKKKICQAKQCYVTFTMCNSDYTLDYVI